MTDTTEASQPTVADVLRDAATVLREKGWCRSVLHDERGRHCAVGAIATLGTPLNDNDLIAAEETPLPAVAALETFLGLPSKEFGLRPLVDWNDRVAEDGEHVAQTFEKAAAAWEEVQGLDA